MRRKQIILTAVFIVLGLVSARAGLAQAEGLHYEGAEPLPDVEVRGQPAVIHTQGLYVTDKYYFVTGRCESEPRRALLLRFSRDEPRSYDHIDITPHDVQGQPLDHPGGCDVDAQGRLWIPVSTSHAAGPTVICRFTIDLDGPAPLRGPDLKFPVNDHIGAICHLADGAILGANWDTKRLYVWSADGKLIQTIDQDALFPQLPHWRLAVQDWKTMSANGRGLILAGGLDKSHQPAVAVLQLIDLTSRRILWAHQPTRLENVSVPVTNEGLAVRDDTIYLLPEDIGRGAKILRYKLPARR